MDLSFTPDERAFRERMRRLLPTEIPAHDPRATSQRGEHVHHRRADPGAAHPERARPGGAALAGAMGRPGLDAACSSTSTRTRCSRPACRAPLGFNTNMVGPVIAQFGSEAQKQRFLPPTANLDIWWCQGFSEPGAGSDLASLRTTAVRDGDHYVVNGQKTWTTLAQYADWIFCLCRTDPAAKKQQGISFDPDRHEDARDHRAPDPDHRRRPRGQRGLVRRRAGAGGEPGRRGEQGLGLRQVPARQRAHRHRPGRRLQGAASAASSSWRRWSGSATGR